MAQPDAALRKRQQIAQANRMMFVWVATVSAILGITIVASVFLFQKLLFNEKVLAKKATTVSTLQHNNKVVEDLKASVRVLNTNQALIDSKAKSDDEPVQVVLDALPSDANSSALGASLQEKLLKGKGVTLESLVVDPVAGVESDSNSSTESDSSSSSDSDYQIQFHASVSASSAHPEALKELLQRLERSIRAIDVTTLTVEAQGSKVVLTIEGSAFYEPAKTVELKDEMVTP